MFDASAMSEGPSLNKYLYKGAQLTPLIFDIFLRFRTFFIAMTSRHPVGTRPKMNVFCTFKIGPFVPIKKGRPLDVF